MSRKICVVTGTRAEYGLLRNIMRKIRDDRKMELQVVAAGMHISEEFGYTKNEIIKDGFILSGEVEMISDDDSQYSMAKSIGTGIIGFSNVFYENKPDITVVLGDRTEALAAAIAASYMNIFLAHIHGGDKSQAGLDESARHAITKFAHIHFPATHKSAERIKKLGEEESRIFEVGAPGLDDAVNQTLYSKNELKSIIEIDPDKPFIVVVQHSVSTQPDQAGDQITKTLKAIADFQIQKIVIYPNSDAGGRNIINKINERKTKDNLNVVKSLDRKTYLSLLKFSKALIGNSSSGIIEAASFGVPVINIGIRQKGRERNKNIIDVNHDIEEIKNAFQKALNDKVYLSELNEIKNIYGDGHASEKIVKVLREIELKKEFLQKSISY